MSETAVKKVHVFRAEHDRRNVLWPPDRIARLIAILDSQPDCVAILDRESRIRDLNPSGFKMLGARFPGEILDSEFIVFVDDVFKPAFMDMLTKVYRGQSVDIDVNITALDGHRRRISLRSAPIFSEDDPDRVIEFVAVARDITEQYTGHIELMETRAAVDEAISIKSNFLATMSHELRTPLNAILGFSELMKQGAYGTLGHEKYGGYVDHIHSSGQQLLELIDDVLCISEIEARKGEVVKQDVDVADVVHDSVHLLQGDADKADIHLNVTIGDDLPVLYADPMSLRRILTNLLSNAIKFSFAGQDVMVNVCKTARNVRFSVRDHGIGIAKSSLSELTRPFYRVQDNAQISAPGTGLGLSIVKALVDAHNGHLDIKSIEHVGTDVSFTIPVA